ncbi:DnaD domain-containing protein [Chloroflexota bacterium]
MEKFKGFPPRARFTPIPDLFFSNLLPQISDMAELKTTLHILWTLYRKRGYPRFVTYRELAGSTVLMSVLRGEDRPPNEMLRDALKMASQRGTILHVVLDKEGAPEDAYFLNTETDRQVVAKIQHGEMTLAGLKTGGQSYADADVEPLPDIFTLYEQNIGMLTPMIADELREAEKLYPEDWIRDAIREAVSLNKRSWRYIARILENWLAKGRGDGTHQRDTKKTGGGTDKYVGQKYGHIIRR